MAQASIGVRTGRPAWFGLAALASRAISLWRRPRLEPAVLVFSRPVAGTDSRIAVMDEDFSPLELLAIERRRCIELQRENVRLRHLCDRLGLRVQILEQV